MPAAGWMICFLAVVNTPIYLLLGKSYFGDWSGFWECVRFWLTPDIISFFRGEYGEDRWAEIKLFIFLFLCAATVGGEFLLIKYLGWFGMSW